MIIVPEIETVVVTPPRTGSGSLRRALTERYPRAFVPYHHMEADGVLQGYDRWRRFGLVREPVDRLWSLYKFIWCFPADKHDPAYVERIRGSVVGRRFEDWILNNEFVFTSPYESSGHGRFFPLYCVRHSLPENRKSQFLYLRPDLGTEVFPYARYEEFAESLGLIYEDLEIKNRTKFTGPPELDEQARAYVNFAFQWDIFAAKGLVQLSGEFPSDD